MAGLISSWFTSAATEIPCSGAMSLFHHLLISDRLDLYEKSPKRSASSTPWSAMFLAVSRELLLSPQSPAAPKLKSGPGTGGGLGVSTVKFMFFHAWFPALSMALDTSRCLPSAMD